MTNAVARTEIEWTSFAKSPVTVEQIGTFLYGFGTELAALRIFRKYNVSAFAHVIGSVNYSQSRKSFYFSLEINLANLS